MKNKLFYFAVLFTILALALTACRSSEEPTPIPSSTQEPTAPLEPTATPEPEALPSLDELGDGWNMLSPGGDTICSNGTEFSFFVRPGNLEKLLLYFQGGGACWFGEICDLTANPTYDPFVDETDNPAENPIGIFDLENPENPFADYSMVFVPYCTGDVHLGNKVVTYEVGATDDVEAHEVTIFHNGYVNATTVLDWTFDNFEAPETVFVTGSSAGAMPSPFYAASVAEQYPDAHIAQLGDAAGGYRSSALGPIMQNWGTMDILPEVPEYGDVSGDNLTFETFYIASASRYPEITFAQYNAYADETQLFFLSLVGVTDTPLIGMLEANFADINGAVENFRTYTAGGVLHGILGGPEFYTYQVDGLRFRDWVAGLAAGEEIENVMCTDCENAE